MSRPNVIDGLKSFFRAVNFLFEHTSLFGYFLIPLAINILIFGTGTWTFIHYYNEIVNAIAGSPEGWWQQALYWATKVGLPILFGGVVIFGFTVVGAIVASPFLDALSQRTEELRTGQKQDEPFSLKVIAGDAKDAVLNELRKFRLLILVQLGILLFNIVPGIGQAFTAIASPLWVIFFLSYEFLDFTLSRKRVPYKERWSFIRQNKGACFGFGGIVFLTTLVPLLNFFVLPIAVIASTLLYVDITVGPRQPKAPSMNNTAEEADEVINDVLSDS